jgi:hypothetical protein
MGIGPARAREVRMRKSQPPIAHIEACIWDKIPPAVLQSKAAPERLFPDRPTRKIFGANLNRRRHIPMKVLRIVPAKREPVIDVVFAIGIAARIHPKKGDTAAL